MTAPAPQVNALVEVVLADSGAVFPSRVEDVTEGDLVVAGPPDAVTRDPGSEVFVSWAGERGRLEQSARLVADQAGPQRRWRVRLEGEVRRSNRRNYVRASVAFPLTVSTPGMTFAGSGLDVSEGGLRCRLPKPKDQKDQDAQTSRALAALDGQVTVRFTLEGEEFTMPGTVVRTIPVEGGGRELGIRFVGVTRGSADSIRRAVFAVERRQRAAGVLG